jgi:hypothetical protein
MAFTQLIFRKKNLLATIQLDVVINETALATSRVTANPVESAADINDHIIIEPMAFTVEGVVSDISPSIIENATTFLNQFSENTRRSQVAWEALLKLRTDKTIFKLEQGLRSYDNVVIESIQEAQDKDTSRGLFFYASLRQIILVGVGAITSDNFNDTNIADKMVPTVEGGLKQLTTEES